MAEWWNALALELQIFYGIGILATIILVIQMIMTLIGADGAGEGDLDVPDIPDGTDGFDGAMDGDSAIEHGSGLQVLSIRTIIAFLAGFGWTGAIVREAGKGVPLSVGAALVVGILLMLGVFWMMRGLYSLRQSGSLDYINAVGEVGTVYVTIPAAGGGEGQIQVLVQGRLATVAAMTDGDVPIPSGRKVRVTHKVSISTLKVEQV